jgi:hypothetical protein
LFGAGEALRFKFSGRFFVFVSKTYRNGQFLCWTFCWTFYWTGFIGLDEGSSLRPVRRAARRILTNCNSRPLFRSPYFVLNRRIAYVATAMRSPSGATAMIEAPSGDDLVTPVAINRPPETSPSHNSPSSVLLKKIGPL